MSDNKHHKHPPLNRPSRGKYHKNEWAIYGTTCDRIADIFQSLDARLSKKYTLIYIDADHNTSALSTELQIGKKQFRQSQEIEWNEYDDRLQTWHSDAVIVNGNHYSAERQIVVIDIPKKESLQRRVEQLTQIDVIVKLDDSPIYDFVIDKMNENTVVVSLSEIEKIEDVIIQQIEKNTAPLKAIILAGGKSKRMGQDKSEITYYNKSQQLHIADICQSIGLDTYISKSHNFDFEHIENYPVIKDRIVDMGPTGAILSAMMIDPDAAWLVVACDLPFITKETLNELIALRNPSKQATAYILKDQDFPEPLIAIYEPNIYQRMLRFLSLGYACPRKVLINSDVKKIELSNAKIAFNANTEEEKNKVIQGLKM